MIFSTNVTKEDFKRAYTSCLKEAWIFHSQANFNQAVEWGQEQIFTYNVKSDVEDSTDYESDASSINIFEVFQEVYAKNDPEELIRWNELWTNEQGFEILDYPGDAIVDGNAVGNFAQKYFLYQMEENNLKNGTTNEAISFEHYAFNDALKATQKALEDNSQVQFMFEAAFSYDNLNLKTRCDILELKENQHVNLYEVKATSKVKKEHFFDIAYQVYILEKNGFIVDKVMIVTLNPEYVYGFNNEFDLSKEGNRLFENSAQLTYEEVLNDIHENQLLIPFTNEIENDLDINKTLAFHEIWKTKKATKNHEGIEVSLLDAYRILDKDLGMENLLKYLANFLNYQGDSALNLMKKTHCQTVIDWSKKYQNFYYKNSEEETWCSHVLPWYDKNRETIFNLTGSSTFTKKVKAGIFYQTGKIYFDEIQTLEGLSLTKNHFQPQHYRIFDVYKKQMQGVLQPKDLLDINHLEVLKATLQQFFQEKEIYMYDFETAKWALPKFWHSKTYQQIPFQYSVDIIYNDDYDYKQPDSMYHHDFLSSKLVDPRPDFIVNFINDMLIKHQKGIYVAYNKAFEQMVLKHLAVAFPKYAKPLLYIAHHTIDLMDFFKGKKGNDIQEERPWFLIYHPNFHGSYSIKKTQPALDASFTYEDLTINKGDKASQTFRQYLDGSINPLAWKNNIQKTMLDYCNRDTLAMVVILKQVEILLKKYEQEKNHE